jgi:uncharacterized protein
LFKSVKYSALCLTHRCNLRCSYCYTGDKVNRRMTRETAFEAIDFLADQSEDRCVATFFGGEPLLEGDLLKEVVLYSREKYGGKIDFRVNTNGTLLDSDWFTFFKEHRLHFAVSLDGNRAQHDTSRKFAGGDGSYDRIADKLEGIFEFDPYTVAVSVVVPDTVEYLAEGVRDIFDKGFRYVVQTLDYSANWRSRDIKQLESQYRKVAKFYRQALKEGRKITYSPFDERIKTWAQKPYERGDLCDLANSQIAIAASGQVYPCVQFVGDDTDQHRENAIGSVTSGFDTGKRTRFIEENYLDKTSCEGCELYGRCATFCGCVNWSTTGSISTIPPIICEHERMLMPIVDRLANSMWKKRIPLFERKFYEPTFPVSSYIEDCLNKRGG